MTERVVKRPDELAQRAKSAGLLSDVAIQRLLEDAVRRDKDGDHGVAAALACEADVIVSGEFSPFKQDGNKIDTKSAVAPFGETTLRRLPSSK